MTKPIFNVEKDIPISSAKSSDNVYPFATMEIGDSFIIPESYKIQEKARTSISNGIKTYNKIHSKSYKMTTRITAEGFRVWRIA